MKRFAPYVLGSVILVSLLPVAARAGTEFNYLGKGSARVLDLDIPALRAVGAQSQFKGLTIGLSSAEFGSDPKAAGIGAGRCDYLANTSSATSACDASTRAESTATPASPTGGNDAQKCAANTPVDISVVSIAAVCGKSLSNVTSGSPVSVNEGGGGLINISLDLSNILPGAGQQAEAAKDALVDQVVTAVKMIEDAAPLSQPQIDSISQSLVDHLNAIKEANGPAITILNGMATTNVTSDQNKATITSQIAGVKIGILGIRDPLTDGLVIIEVTGATAAATWDKVKSVASASATPGVATVKVKDIASLCGTISTTTVPAACSGGYIAISQPLPALGNLFSPLNSTLLETSIEAATATPSQEGISAAASTGGLRIRAIKGIGATSASGTGCGSCDGGLDVRIASADVSVSGNKVLAENPPLPKTGGAVYLFFGGAALLAAVAAFGLVAARRIRKAAG